jgi:hypothetical protein
LILLVVEHEKLVGLMAHGYGLRAIGISHRAECNLSYTSPSTSGGCSTAKRTVLSAVAKGTTPNRTEPDLSTLGEFMEKKKDAVRIELTDEQKEQVKEKPAKEVEVELTGEVLEQRIAPLNFT